MRTPHQHFRVQRYHIIAWYGLYMECTLTVYIMASKHSNIE